MAQRTAFLNSDAKWFNKDFHHTWINNYMIKQPWVMFSNYSTKPEFALGNWQISWGKAIIRCTRTTGTFAGEEILACFESTSTENISTAWNKKVYIEIPEVYVNDSTAITDSLTQWANLNVWRIVSSDSYPTHSNYIKLWEITWWDWQNATDLRPEVLRRGKPNTISYFGGNGEEERIDIDNSSLNKFLMSNGAWVAPTWEEWGGWGWDTTVENFKRVFTADDDLLAKSMFWVEVLPTATAADSELEFWTTEITKVFFTTILNGESFSSIKLKLSAVNSPSDSLSIRIETLNANWEPSWTLVDVWAYATATPTSTLTEMTINLSGTVEWLTEHTKVAVVIERSGSASDSNYYTLWVLDSSNVITTINTYDGSDWSEYPVAWCITCDWFATEAVVQATSENWVNWVWYCETWATEWNNFTWILQGTVDYSWALAWAKYYLSSTWTLAVTWSKQVWRWIEDWVLQIWSSAGWGQLIYDAIVATDGSGDYTTLYAAVSDGKRNIYIKSWTYEETPISLTDDITLTWENQNTVVLNYTITTWVVAQSWAVLTVTSSSWDKIYHNISGINFNITETGTVANRYWAFVNANGLNNSSKYKLYMSNCNIIVNQKNINSNFLVWKLNSNAWEILIDNCNIDVSNEDWYQTRFSSYSTSEIININNSNITVHTSSNYGIYHSDTAYIKNNCRYTISSTGSWDVISIIWKAYNCTINASWWQSNKLQMTIRDCNNCDIKWTNAYVDTLFNKSSTVTEWESWKQYSVNDFVSYSWWIYKCKTAHTSSSEFESSYWNVIDWSRVVGITDCTVDIQWTVYAFGNIINNTITDNYWWYIASNNSTQTTLPTIGVLLQSNNFNFENNWYLCIVSTWCIILNNKIIWNNKVYLKDGYHIIKNNYLTPHSSTWSSIWIDWTYSTSILSDNMIRGS